MRAKFNKAIARPIFQSNIVCRQIKPKTKEKLNFSSGTMRTKYTHVFAVEIIQRRTSQLVMCFVLKFLLVCSFM